MSRNKEHRGAAFGGAPNGAAAEGGRSIGAPPKAAPVFPRYVSDHFIS